MRYVSFLHDGVVRPGILEDHLIHPLPEEFASLADFIALPARERAAFKSMKMPVEIGEVKLVAPVRPHKNIFCVGRNYKGHAEEVARASGKPLNLPPVPTFFTKATTSISNPDQTLYFSPEVSSEYDWEAELAVVIGLTCRDVPEAEAHAVIFGYTCLNDLTARDLQREHLQWFKGKSLDYACPIGPWIVGTDEIPDPQTLQVKLRVNGVEKQNANTSTMIFSVAKIIASLSRGMTLEPGDVIATGTPDGVGMARTPPEWLKDGDVVEVDIERIGVLRNRIALGVPAAAAR